MELEIPEQGLERRIMSNSTQSFSPRSSPHTPTHLRRGSSLSDVFDDYRPSEIINNDSEEEYVTEDDILLPDPAPSGRSSISSFPASVVHHDVRVSQTFSQYTPTTPSRSRVGTPVLQQPYLKPISPLSTREHVTGFRNPSSVRALQMRDEFSDNEDLTPSHRRRGSRMSYMSYRSGSAHSTPGKRMSRSLQASPVKNASRLRKEFPLVLLHCSILPSIISPKAKVVNEELLEAIIPEPYKKRWKMLQEKVLRNSELRERGVLIPHPKDEYELLEERFLETIELERSVISNGHYVGRSESRASTADSGFGSEENSSRGDATDEEGEDVRCADCGGHLCGERRWEVKVFAANGLMKAGAWSAAWSEMEKVDVQVSVWLPEDVRLEIEARLDAVIAQEQELEEEVQFASEVRDDERSREIYGDNGPQKRQEDIDGLADIVSRDETSATCEPLIDNQRHFEAQPIPLSKEVNLQQALSNYLSLLLQDKRNLAILILSLLLVSYGISIPSNSASKGPLAETAAASTIETKIEYRTSTVVSTSTLLALETSTVVQIESTVLPTVIRSSGTAQDSQTHMGVQSDSTTISTDTMQSEQHDIADTAAVTTTSLPGISIEIDEATQQTTSAEQEFECLESSSAASTMPQVSATEEKHRTMDEL